MSKQKAFTCSRRFWGINPVERVHSKTAKPNAYNHVKERKAWDWRQELEAADSRELTTDRE